MVDGTYVEKIQSGKLQEIPLKSKLAFSCFITLQALKYNEKLNIYKFQSKLRAQMQQCCWNSSALDSLQGWQHEPLWNMEKERSNLQRWAALSYSHHLDVPPVNPSALWQLLLRTDHIPAQYLWAAALL